MKTLQKQASLSLEVAKGLWSWIEYDLIELRLNQMKTAQALEALAFAFASDRDTFQKFLRLVRSSSSASEGIDRTASSKKAGWTKGVFDQKEIDEVFTPLKKATRLAEADLKQMAKENDEFLRVYGAAGMEYREESRAARETQTALRRAADKLGALKTFSQ